MAKVLVVDDDPDIRELLARCVEQEGHQTLRAGDADQARELMEQRPDLVFLDVDMPGETGVSMMLKFREEQRYTDIPVVFVTAYPERSAPLQRAGAGADNVITKPFHRSDIIDTLRALLGWTD